MFHNTLHRSAEMRFHAPIAEAGSDAEKLLNLRNGMQLRKRELRDSERMIREAARAFRFSSATARTHT